jgi:hypothetical protein
MEAVTGLLDRRTMKLLGWLFGRQPTEEQHSPVPKLSIQQGVVAPLSLADFIEIPSRNFQGECVRSPNGCYTVAWRDGDDSGAPGARRRSEHGRYYLLKGGRVIAEGLMARPNDGKVADNGTFIFNDWGFGDGLKGTFRAFDSLGQNLIVRRFRANLLNNGISFDGRFAVCQTCNAPGSSDGSVLSVFDLTRGAEVGKWMPQTGWANFYDFSQDGVILLGYRGLGAFRYTWTGEFLDREAWHEAILSKGAYGSVLGMAERLIKNANGRPPTELVERLVKAIDRIAPAIVDEDLKTRAWALKLRGVCMDAQGNLREALDCYRRALALDPKAGVKRRADQVRKILGATGL